MTKQNVAAVMSAQGETCNRCRENRSASVFHQGRMKHMPLVSENTLGTKGRPCCSVTVNDEGGEDYECPIFQDLVHAYDANIKAQGATVNPCKHCSASVDNGGDCFSDRCVDGPFPIKE